jgi:cytochrome d ubiquinol oxidase subunit I
MNADALLWHRLQFAFTIVYHYLFPQLTMGLALLIVVMRGVAYFKRDEHYAQAARFFTRIFGVNFAMGVATGLPMEFQFGTNWSRFSGYAGGVIGHSLGMESLFAFFLESSFLGLVLFGEKRLSKRAHFASTVALWLGTWASGYFIVTTNAFMQHPVGYVVGADQKLQLGSLFAYMTNPWGLAAYAHTMMGALVTGSFVVTAVGAYYVLAGRSVDHGRRFMKVGTIAGLCASLAVAFPTGDIQAKLVGKHQPVTLAAMEGHFETESGAPITIIGQPNVKARRLDNPVHVPLVLSFLAYGAFHADVRGLNEFPESDWPSNIELLYYGFHLMVGIGTIQIALMALANALRFVGRLERYRPFLWLLCLGAPLPYIANTAGWMTAEMGRQPWLVYGLYRTVQGASPKVHSGDALFTLIGFAGIYVILSILFLFLVGRIVQRGPDAEVPHG